MEIYFIVFSQIVNNCGIMRHNVVRIQYELDK